MTEQTVHEWYEVTWHPGKQTPPTCEYYQHIDRARLRANRLRESEANQHVTITRCTVVDFDERADVP